MVNPSIMRSMALRAAANLLRNMATCVEKEGEKGFATTFWAS